MLKILSIYVMLSCDPSASDLPPPWPGHDETGYTVETSSTWLMVGDGLTQPDDTYVITIEPPSEVTEIDLWIDSVGPERYESSGEGTIVVELDVSGLESGEHGVVMAAPGASSAFARRVFKRSHALYVILAADWDDPDNDQRWLDNMDELRQLHSGLRYTHYFGPYSLTDPSIPPSRRQELVDWLIERRDLFGDEIGVHLHPYCSFVETTDISCRDRPSFAYPEGDPSGYTVVVASYSTEEMTALLQATIDLFEDSGLGRPRSFRSGGWTGDASTCAALASTEFTVQADAIVSSYIEEWDGRALYDWLMDHWGTITTTHQPYYPTSDDIAAEAEDISDALPVLQVPANAVIVDYVWDTELIDIFEENFQDGAPLRSPTVVHTGLHPTNFGDGFLSTLHLFLDATADVSLYENDEGPVIYTTAGEMAAVF